MNFENSSIGRRALLAALVVTGFVAAPGAKADLVYDNPAAAPSADSRDAQRESVRQVIGTSQRFQTGNNVVAAPAPANTDPNLNPPVAMPPANAVAAPATDLTTAAASASEGSEVQSLSRSELLRRERLREELKNEDVIQERLEELRLRDEQRRTNQMFGAKPADAVAPQTEIAPIPAPMQQEVVTTPVTDRPGQPAPYVQAPAQAAPTAVQYPRYAPGSQQMGYGQQMAGQQAAEMDPAQSQAVAGVDAPKEDKTTVSIMPRLGLANMASPAGFNVDSKGSFGVTLGFAVSDNASFELGYSYNQYGISLQNSYIPTAISPYTSSSQDTRQLNQNVFEAGLKYDFFDKGARIRPFIGAGGGYSTGYVNFDSQYQAQMQQYYGSAFNSPDYNITQYLGYLQTGLDISVSKSFAFNLTFKYYDVLSSSQNLSGGLPYNSAYNPGGYNYYGPSYYQNTTDQGNSSAGASLAGQNFYNLTAGATLSF